MTRWKILVLACLLIPALGAAYVFDPFPFFLLIVWPCGLTAMWMLVGLLLVGTGIMNGRSWSECSGVLKWGGGALLILMALCGVNYGLFRYAEHEAMAYPLKVKPLLEQYRADHGRYPDSLAKLSSRPPLPRLYRGDAAYGSDGYLYEFHFPVPGGLIDDWNYSNDTGEWHRH